jgi:hypothetical protein
MQPWNTARATIYGVAIGLTAAAVKLVAPWSEPHGSAVAMIREFVGAGVAFGLLCGLAAAFRNFVARRLIWRQLAQDLRDSSGSLATVGAIPRDSIPLRMDDAARISASLIFGSSDRRTL